jgi:hypothetical protein
VRSPATGNKEPSGRTSSGRISARTDPGMGLHGTAIRERRAWRKTLWRWVGNGRGRNSLIESGNWGNCRNRDFQLVK